MRAAEPVVVTPGTTVGEAIRRIDAGGLGLVLVCGEGLRLQGIVTDVDVRKGLLRGMRLEDAVETIMFARPTVAAPGTPRGELEALMRRSGIRQIPVVTAGGLVVGVEILKDGAAAPARDTEVVIMAGGRGSRLRPLTDALPKPMLSVGGRPLLEILVERLRGAGLGRFRIAVNYKRELIEAHFGEGERWGVEIAYLREPAAGGTAGALRLLEPRPERPFLVVNGDLLTELNFEQLLDFHDAQGGVVTLCVKPWELPVPFGVVECEGTEVRGLREKPVAAYHVNAGVYVLDPKVLDLLGGEPQVAMTDLIRRVLERGWPVRGFHVREAWLDIGSEADYQRALAAFEAPE